jgi:hypothetical protein
LDSNILSTDIRRLFDNICKFPTIKTWKLLYRGSRDGFTSRAFHSRCDEIIDTVTIIKSDNGNIFGGFASFPWNSANAYYDDPQAFIFSLINKENEPFKITSADNTEIDSGKGHEAIHCNPNAGPIFGGGFDLFIGLDGYYNYSYIGYSYKHPNYKHRTERANAILGGSCSKWTLLEIEVFGLGFEDHEDDDSFCS